MTLEEIQHGPDQVRLVNEPRALMLAEITDLELMRRMLKEQYLYKSVHPLDKDYILICYSKKAQITGKWNEATKLARGLIVRSSRDDLADAVVLQRPWEKFFTLQQQESGWHLGDEENSSSADSLVRLDFDAPARVYDKLDGSLGILYRDPSGLPALATKGSFVSEQARVYTDSLRSNSLSLEAAEEILQLNDITALFELIGPKNRIVLKYDESAVVLLGGNSKRAGVSVDPEVLTSWVSRGLPVVEELKAGSLREALELPPRENREGLVVSLAGENPMKIKLKQADYTRLHRIVTMFSKRESRAIVFELESTYADLLKLAETEDVAYFDPIREVLEIDGFTRGDDSYEFIRSRRESYFKEILIPRAKAIQEAQRLVESLDESYFTGDNPQKRFAGEIDGFPVDRTSLFTLYRARLEGKRLDELNAFQELRRAVRDVKDAKD